MTTVLAVAGFAALFVAFGLFRPGAKTGCGNCSCTGGTCRLEDDESPGIHSH
ncbi:MAG: hypothetical protein Q8W45_04235 [Candidatus Palauibacterales bacterium]|jgi:hypothetical protein|nr:hypothetical protein [Candidatus Palauibacterales bacterium]